MHNDPPVGNQQWPWKPAKCPLRKNSSATQEKHSVVSPSRISLYNMPTSLWAQHVFASKSLTQVKQTLLPQSASSWHSIIPIYSHNLRIPEMKATMAIAMSLIGLLGTASALRSVNKATCEWEDTDSGLKSRYCSFLRYCPGNEECLCHGVFPDSYCRFHVSSDP